MPVTDSIKLAIEIVRRVATRPESGTDSGVVEALRVLLDLGADVPCPEISYQPDRAAYDIEWIVAEGSRLFVNVHGDGTVAWAALLGKNRVHGTDLGEAVKARDLLARLTDTKGD